MHRLALVLTLLISNTVRALPETERTDDTKLWLAVAFVAEAGWAGQNKPKAEADHRGIFHVLKNRWPRLKRRFPKRFPRYVDVVQAYVAALDPRTKGKRVRWLLRMGLDPTQAPAYWPAKVKWSVHKPLWIRALQRAQDCLAGTPGKCRDPYKGKALHWGGEMDRPTECMVLLPNAGTYNDFYGVDTECTRDRRQKRKGEATGRVLRLGQK